MIYSVSSYSFERLFISKEYRQLADCLQPAKKMGYDAVEIVDLSSPDGSSRLAYAQSIKEQCGSLGLAVSNYSFELDLLTGSGGDIEKEIQKAKDEIEIAVALGAASVRHDVTWGYADRAHGGSQQDFIDLLPELAASVREIASYAEKKGIKTMTENHGYFMQESSRLEMLYKAVDHENFGLLADLGNFLCVDEDPISAINRLLPYIRYVHAKDFFYTDGGNNYIATRAGRKIQGAVLGQGAVPVQSCIELLKSHGYNGSIAVEYEGEEPVIAALERSLDYLKSL